MKQSEADPNLCAPALSTAGWAYHPVAATAARVEGLPWSETEGHWDRLPRALMSNDSVRAALRHVAAQPSGGRIRFNTTASTWALRARLARTETCVHNTVDSLSGFDCYARPAGMPGARPIFVRCAAPGEDPALVVAELERPRAFAASAEVEWTVYLPLQNPVASLELAFPADAPALPPAPARLAAPVVFHGSSITQGFSCTRPGLTYPAIIARDLDLPFVNLGYGGNAKGDPEVATAIAALPMSLFVCDLDFNLPSVEEIADKHAAFVATIRRAHPMIPILCVSAPNYWNDSDYFGRRAALIERTVLDARAGGDTRIEFLHGRDFWDADRAGDFTVDTIHPNDVGFARMAAHIGARVQALLTSS